MHIVQVKILKFKTFYRNFKKKKIKKIRRIKQKWPKFKDWDLQFYLTGEKKKEDFGQNRQLEASI